MKKLLIKISWLTRKWNFEFSLFSLTLNTSCGFKLLTINRNYKEYSLLSLDFRLPNNTNVRKFTIDTYDILFLYTPIWIYYDKLRDSIDWGVETNKWDKIKVRILSKIL